MTYRVLTYHTVGTYPEPLPAGIETSPASFRRQLDWLLSSGFQIVPLHRVVAQFTSKSDHVSREVAITFDDGYADCLRYAIPALVERNLPATFFVVAGVLGSSQVLGNVRLEMLSPDDLKAIARVDGLEIGSHGLSHRSLTGLSGEELTAELTTSRRLLEAAIDRPVRYLSYPYGDVNESVRLGAKEAGYEEGFTVWTRSEGPFSRLRIPLHARDGLLRFAFKLSQFYFPVKSWCKP